MYKKEKEFGFSKFLKDENQKILLLNTPNYGNVGDSAITLGEISLLQDNFPDRSIYEFSGFDDSFHLKEIEKHTSQNDVVLINGGGSIGSLWRIEHARIMRILRVFKEHKIVICPQTIFFREEEKDFLSNFIDTIKGCKDLTILVREENSFNFLKSINAPCKFLLVPDAALYLEPKSPPHHAQTEKVLLCFRKDHEKIAGNSEIVKFLRSNNIKFDRKNTNVPQIVSKQGREKFVQRKIDQFSRYKLVITDRLHGMVLSALASTPCLAFDNLSKKVSGVNVWMKDLEFVKCVGKQDFSSELFEKLYNFDNAECKYDRKTLFQDFQKIVDAIRN